ncbi:MAG: OsmC family peroxiredoxin [Anaerolineae bacterium]|nr:OsmC family peroxiredoxin [Anaerolineae bacterium]
MADLERSANAVWHGDLRSGNGQMSAGSGLFKDAPYTFATRFEHAPGTNPDELLAAALASCFSMALANKLSKDGRKVDHIQTQATCVLSPQPQGGFKISGFRLNVKGKVEGLDAAAFQQAAAETAAGGCPVSIALGAVKIDVTDAALA